jgi:hypothetical protein
MPSQIEAPRVGLRIEMDISPISRLADARIMAAASKREEFRESFVSNLLVHHLQNRLQRTSAGAIALNDCPASVDTAEIAKRL